MQNLTRRLAQLSDKSEAYQLLMVLTDVYERFRSVCFDSAGLAITGAGATTVSTGASATHLVTQGVLQSIAAGTVLPALSGTVTNGAFNVFVFSVDKAGTVHTDMGTEGATLNAVRFPNIPATRTIIGYVVINPTGTGNFVGGTTALDDAVVVPNAAYVNTTGAFDVNAVVV